MTIDLSKASPAGRAIAQSILDRKASDQRLTCSVADAQGMLGHISDTHLTKLIAAEQIKSFVLGGRRVIYVASLYDYLIEAAIYSYPADEPPRKLNRPVHEALAERKARGLPVKGLSGGAVMHEHSQARKAAKAKAETAKPQPFRSQPLA